MNSIIDFNKVIKKMDKDCAVRTVISLIGGRDNFLKQFIIECNIMSDENENELKKINTK
jgi:hypothetical protein